MEVRGGALFDPVDRALDSVALDVVTLTDGEVRSGLVDTERLAARLRGLQARLLAEANRRELDRRDGCASPAAWVTSQLGISAGEAARRQEEAAAVTVAPRVAQALDRGEITPEHVRTVTATARQEPGMDVDELLRDARAMDAGRFTRRAAQLRRAHHADGGLSQHESQRRNRRCSIRVRPEDGMVVLHAELDPLVGAKVQATLFGEADRLWMAERAGAEGGGAPDTCTSPQRLADALANVFGRPPTAGLAPETAEVLVTMSYEDLVAATRGDAEVVGVGPIPAAVARRLACEAGIIPVVLGGRSEVLDLGRSRRLASRAQRLALRHAHASCAIDGCDVPFDWCQVHHLRPWSTGGRTDLSQLAPLCTRHHHLAHEGGWTLSRRTDGTIASEPPPSQRPQPNDREHAPLPTARLDPAPTDPTGSSASQAWVQSQASAPAPAPAAVGPRHALAAAVGLAVATARSTGRSSR